MLRRIIFVFSVVMLMTTVATAQVWEKNDRKYKGASEDGSDRSEYFFKIEKLDYPVDGVCEGEPVTLALTVENVFAYTYQWYKIANNKTETVQNKTVNLVIPASALSDRGDYFCKVSDVKTGKTLYSDTVTLRIRKMPVVRITNFTYPKTICYGDELIVDASATESDKESADTYTYFWGGRDIIGATDQIRIKASPGQNTIYGLTVNNQGCIATGTVEVRVNKAEVDLPDFIYKTQGERLELKVDAPESAELSWTVGGVSYGNINPLVIDPVSESSAIKVRMVNGECSAEDSSQLLIRRSTGFRGGAGDGFERADHQVRVLQVTEPGLICEGTEETRMQVVYDGTLAYHFEWKKVGSDEVLGDSATLVFREVKLTDRGHYFCKLTDIKSAAVTYSDTVEFKIKKLPNIVIGSPELPKLLCYGESVLLNASATETDREEKDTYTYLWQGEGIVGVNNAAVVKVEPKVNTIYRLTVRNGECTAIREAEVNIYRPVVDLPDYVYVSEGNTLELPVDAPAGARLIWTADGNTFEDINPFRYPDISKSMEVKVRMINDGCAAEDKCMVYVKRGRGYKGGIQDGFDVTCVPPSVIKQPESIKCGAEVAELEVIAEGTDLTYFWQRYNAEKDTFVTYVPPMISNALGLGSHRLLFNPVVPEDNGLYRCIVVNECGELSTDTVLLSVAGAPVLKRGLQKEWAQCAGASDSVYLEVEAIDPMGKAWKPEPLEGLHYTWYRNGRKITGAAYDRQNYLKWPHTEEAEYLVNIQNECGSTRDSVKIPVLSGAQIVKPIIDILTCLGGDAEFVITVNGGGTVNATLFRGPKSAPQLIATTTSGRYTMRNVRLTDEGEYFWAADNGCGVDTSNLFYLGVNTQLQFTGRTRDTLLCANENLDLEVAVNDNVSALTYNWYRNGRPTGVSSARYPIRSANASDAGSYTCKVSNGCPARESDPIIVTIKEQPRITVQPYLKSAYCQGDTLTVGVTVANMSTVDSIRWYYNNRPLTDISGKIGGTNTTSLKFQTIEVADAGAYHVQLFSSCGGVRSNIVTLKVEVAPSFITDLSGYRLNLCDGDNVTLEVTASGATPISYKWTHKDKVIKNGFEPSVVLKNIDVDSAGKYCVTIENRCGNKVSCTELKVNRPDTFHFELNSLTDHICQGDRIGLTAVLKGSDTTTLYTLYKGTDEFVRSVNGKNVVPKQGFIEFKGLMGGTYYVVGEGITGCKYRMPGTVKIMESPQPKIFNTLIDKHICQDLQQAVIALDSSELNTAIEYTLMVADGTEWKPYLDKQRGTGDTLRWKNIPEGTYKIVAKNTMTACSADMRGEVKVMKRGLPVTYKLVAKNADSTYCVGAGSDVILMLTGSESDVTYTLKNASGSVGKGVAQPLWSAVEAGNYYVYARNQWGCETNMGRQSVIAQQPPKASSIEGGMIYCETQKGNAEIKIVATEKGILYRMYRENPSSLFLDTMGTGTAVNIAVPLENKSYYVVAEDTTSEHCRTRLSGTAVFKMSQLKVNCMPDEYTISSGATQQLNAVVSGATGDCMLNWHPAELLDPLSLAATPNMPVTIPLNRRTDYTVNVTDETGCSDSAVVSVLVTSADYFNAEIRVADKVTPVADTLKACKGSRIELYAWVDGGSGIYDYRWYDESGEKGSGQYLTGYTRPAEGFLWLEVSSDGQVVKDSVWVKLYDIPAIQALSPEGVVCAQNGIPVKLTLSGSQKNMTYILSYSSDNTRYNEIDTITGTGGRLEFMVANAYVREGYYRVRAESPFAGGCCQLWMSGIAEVRKGARKFDLSGDKIYCEGINDVDTIRMAGSQSGITYTLYRAPAERKALQSGKDNKPLEFTGRFGSGEYFVLGSNGVCADTMNGFVKIQRNPLPLELSLPEAGGYCGDCPEQITITAAEPGVDYMLWRKNAGQADSRLETLNGSGELAFAQHCEHGEYYIVAQNVSTGCERVLKDRVKIGVSPSDVVISGEGKYCDSESAYTGGFRIAAPQDGVDYRLFTDVDSVYVGTFDSVALSGLYYTRPLQAGTYQVIASVGTSGGCSHKLSQKLTVIKYALPSDNKLIEPYTICRGEGKLRMGITTSDGFTYSLYYNDGVNTTHKATVPGSGGETYFGSFDDLGTYHVMVKSSAYACEWRMPGEFKVDKPLEVFNITGEDRYCMADGGVVIGIDSTEREVKYVLQKWDTLNYVYKEVDALTGQGRSVVFRGYFGEGQYKIRAVRGCERDMNGILDVKSKAMPSAATVLELIGNGCQDSTIIIGLRKAEAGVTYTLYFNGSPAGRPILSDGADTAWHIARAGLGTYQVTADKENCMVTMPRTIEIGRCPFVNELHGDTVLCSNLRGTLWMEAGKWDKGAVYTLYNVRGDSITKGFEKGGDGRLYFTEVPVGTYYAVAKRGDCVIWGEEPYTIKGVDVPVLPENFWTVSNCVLSGEGEISITGMRSDVRYIMQNSAGLTFFDYKGTKTDTLFTGMDFERYCIYGLNERNNCKSDILCEEIREGVGEDIIVGDFHYCGNEAGASLRLSGSGRNMSYKIKSETGEVIEQLAAGATVFTKQYKAGKYVFRKERTGFMGGCYSEDTLTIVHYNDPDITIHVDISGNTALCSNGDYTVTLRSSEPDVRYILIKDAGAATEVYLDTLMGNGNILQFAKKLNDAGIYNIYAEPLGGLCGNMLDTSFRLKARPRAVMLESCDYCVVPGEKDSCALNAAGLAPEILYKLYAYPAGGNCIDSLYGPGKASFKGCMAGSYYVIGEDAVSGCADTVARAQIRERIAPERFTVDQVCDTLGVIRTVDGSSGDTVAYYLWRDTVQIAGPLAGTGRNLDFGTVRTPGVYKIKAVNEHGCEVWMKDSATVFSKPQNYALTQEGSYCEEGTQGVTIRYEGSDKGWNYFLKKGMWYTDTLPGTGMPLEWNSIADNRILSQGTYELYRINACGKTLVKSVEVKSNPLPRIFDLAGADGAVCAGGEGLEISLSGSQLGVSYKLMWVNGETESELKQVSGTGFGIGFDKYTEAGQYIVYAVVDSSGCRAKMGERMFWPGAIPDVLKIKGNDICLDGGAQTDVTICLDAPAAVGVDYYLKIKTSDIVPVADTIFAGSAQCFEKQSGVACYYVTARDTASGCESEMDGLVCVGYAPVKYRLVKDSDTVSMCRGEEYCIKIDNSQIGTKYILTRNGVEYGSPAAGEGYMMTVGCVADAGVYRVKALTGEGCQPVIFDDSIVIQVNELPEMSLKKEYAFCTGEPGATVTIDAPTDPQCKYELFSPQGISLNVRDGNGGMVTFDGTYAEPGKYTVHARNEHNCTRIDTVVLKQNLLPGKAILSGSNGKYVCGESEAVIQTDVSETGVEYTLFRRVGGIEKLIGRKYGTGETLNLGKVREAGVYFVEATNIQTGCKVRMVDELELTPAPAIDVFRVEGIRTGYCYSDSRKGSLKLSDSRAGIFYRLVRDSVDYGTLREGNNGQLEWQGLEGAVCAGNVMTRDTGYIYRVTALDTATGCVAWMEGAVNIIEEADVQLKAFRPLKDTTVCEGDSVAFVVEATGCNLNYLWKKEKAIVKNSGDNFLAIPRVATADFGTYLCEVSNTCSSVPTSGVRLKVRGALKYLRRIEDVAVCAGSDLTLTGYIQNGTEHEWFRIDDEDNLLSIDSWLTLYGVTPEQAGTYVYRSKNDCGTLADTVVVRVDTESSGSDLGFRTDTLCVGSEYNLQVVSGDSVRWYRGNTFTGVSGNNFRIDSVIPVNEGVYSVHIFNACGEKVIDAAQLYVDDTIQVIAVRPDEGVCDGAMVDLYVRTIPDKRITYTWLCNGDTIAGADKSTLRVGPVTADMSVQYYEVIYSNKCGTGTDTTILSVSDRIEYEDPVPELLLCNGPGMPRDTFIFVKHQPLVSAVYQWYWRETADGDPVKLEGEVRDTLDIPLNTTTRGYYFCEIGNVCNPAVTNNSLVKIDTVPVLLNNLPENEVICEKTPYHLTVAANGGDLYYEWGCRLRNGTVETYFYDTVAMRSQSIFDFGNIGVEYDSCKIWCRVYNGCGEITSDTLLLRVNALPKLSITPRDSTICQFSSAQVILRQTAGIRPWTYRYGLGEENEQERTCNTVNDTLYLSDEGTWKFWGLTDGQCAVFGLVDSIKIQVTQVPKITVTNILAQDTVCMGGEVQYRLSVEDGTGPFEITMFNKLGQPADELGMLWPYVLTERSEILSFLAVADGEYYIGQVIDRSAVAGACPVYTEGKIKVVIDEPVPVSFRTLSDNHLGACRPVDLDTLLMPQPSGGAYIVNGVMSTTICQLQVGCDTVRYIVESSVGCISERTVLLYADSLPSARMLLPRNVCTGADAGLEIPLNGNGYKFLLTRTRVDRNGGNTVESVPVRSVSDSYKERLVFLPSDSCVIYKLSGLEDRHGCTSAQVLQDSVYVRSYPELEIFTRYPDQEGQMWSSSATTLNITKGDSVAVRASLVKGVQPWTLRVKTMNGLQLLSDVSYNGLIHSDTILRIGDNKHYYFSAADAYCTTRKEIVRTVNYADTGYIRVAALLEGPYDATANAMKVGKKFKVPLLEGMNKFPDVGNRTIIDWVEISLRRGTTAEKAAQSPSGQMYTVKCLLLSDGTVVDAQGRNQLIIPYIVKSPAEKYYVLIRHRNHLGVMSASAYELGRTKQAAPLIDFRMGNIYINGGTAADHMSQVYTSGGWALSAGEFDQNALTSMYDVNGVALNKNDEISYSIYDINFDGKIDWAGTKGATKLDWSIVWKNKDKHCEIKW